MDSEADLEERLNDFVSTVLFSTSKNCIVVGHSLFLLAFFKRFCGNSYLEHDAALLKSDLMEKKVGCCLLLFRCFRFRFIL
jgi:hypothetical protein